MSRKHSVDNRPSSILSGIRSRLGLLGDDDSRPVGKKKRPASRKEKRKMEREAKKQTRRQHTAPRRRHEDEESEEEEENRKKKSKRDSKRADIDEEPPSKRGKPSRPAPASSAASASASASMDPEDAEIARLERLLGVGGKDRASAAKKLNKEFEMFEGIGENFGDFLMQLDDLHDSIAGKSKTTKSHVFADEDYDSDAVEEVGGAAFVPRLLDEDEQPESDVSVNDDDDDSGREDDEEEEEEGDEDDSNEEEPDDYEEESSGEDIGENSGDEEEEEEEEEDVESIGNSEVDEDESGGEGAGEGDSGSEEEAPPQSSSSAYYRPSRGEDLYGRITSSSSSASGGGKYVPPALRNKQNGIVDENSEKYVLLRRVMNGLMNRLSDQSKDSIVRSIKELFDANGMTMTSHCLNNCIIAACGNATQIMGTLIPLFAALAAALHSIAGMEVGASLLEVLVTKLHEILHETKKTASQHSLISDKRGNNMLLIIVYLYNLRIVHHSLLIDILNHISELMQPADADAPRAEECEALLELLFGALDNGGSQLRHDDPDAFRGMIAKVVECTRPYVSKGNTRVDFIVSNIADLNMNKSKRIKSAAEENIVKLRKWLGSIKSLLGSRPGELCLHVSLNDLLLAENRGRWWRAGAAWAGRDKSQDASEATSRAEYSSTVSREQTKLLTLAQKMRMNTPLRRDIFVVMMSSSDAMDAFERLSRLDLKGKQDREILRVVLECCGQEKTYNEFYSELASLLCEHNRQHKTTVQFAFWDAFKTLDDEQFSNRRAINLARMLSHLVANFHVSLSVLKVIDMSAISDRMILFLATFFLALLSSSVSDDKIQSIFDRVATTSDYAVVRDNISFFLQKYFAELPGGLEPDDAKRVLRRRKTVLKTMAEMTVLDVARAQGKADDSD